MAETQRGACGQAIARSTPSAAPDQTTASSQRPSAGGIASTHSGVYVPVTGTTQPNPYLDHPKRDVVTSDGQRLTLVNPAYMTRQIAEIAEKADGARFHITSIKPIRPANSPDAWEAESLRLFESGGLKERLGFFADGGGAGGAPVNRFMAPLLCKAALLSCH